MKRALTPLGLAVAMLMTACGGGGDGGGFAWSPVVPPSADNPTSPPAPANPPAAPPPANPPGPGEPQTPFIPVVSKLELAQTHVIPPEGLRMAATNLSEELHAVGGREALALVRFETPPDRPVGLEGLQGGTSLGVVALAAPSALPVTESGGEAYAPATYSATLPSSWMRPGLQLRAASPTSAFDPGAAVAVKVAADTQVKLRILPFYLFGATDANTYPLAQIRLPAADTLSEIFAKWPVGKLDAEAHPAGRAEWPRLLIAPRTESGTPEPSYVISSAEQQKDGFAVMNTVLVLLGLIRNANGDGPGPDQFYAPLMMIDNTGKYRDPDGGRGTTGGGASVGDFRYAGIFIHEQGHALGISHQGDQYELGRYPYVAGSLLGSAWGYDQIRQQFLAPFLPSSASSYAGCKTQQVFSGRDAGGNNVSYLRRVDAAGRCVKQDPMQSGAGDEAAGYRYATFADFSTGRMQRYFEGSPPAGNNYKPDGPIYSDAAFASGYKRWNTATLRWEEVVPTTESNGMFRLDMGLPIARNLPVHTIAMSLSNAAPKRAMIYPPLTYTGNLLRTIDPNTPEGRAAMLPDTGSYPWYCRNGGCDYTVRVTYANGTVRHVALQRGFRPINQPRGTEPASASDPLSTSSFINWAVNVPADNGGLSRVDLLSTPMVWEGVPANPTVLATLTM